MARLSRRAKKQQQREIVFGLLIIAAVLVIVGLVGYQLTHRSDGYDPETLCPLSGPKGHYVLLVDKTDPLSFTQKTALQTLFTDFVEHKVPQGNLISVFVVGEDYTLNAKPLVEICNPGTGEDKSELTANLKQLKRQYSKKFLNPLGEQFQAMTSDKSAKFSPILEMLQMVNLESYQRHPMDGERHLLIVSDMLHNTPGLSLYKNIPSIEDFQASNYGRKSYLELKGVDVELYLLVNSPQYQGDELMGFWRTYFESIGAKISKVVPMPG
jgi:hypothetical protein